MSRTRRIAVITASVATAGILGVTGVAYAGDYDGGSNGHDGGHHHSRHHDHDGGNHGRHGGWDNHRGYDHGRCNRDRDLIGNLLHSLLGGGC